MKCLKKVVAHLYLSFAVFYFLWTFSSKAQSGAVSIWHFQVASHCYFGLDSVVSFSAPCGIALALNWHCTGAAPFMFCAEELVNLKARNHIHQIVRQRVAEVLTHDNTKVR